MNTIIYYIVGTLDGDKFEIKVNELQVKRTTKSFKYDGNNWGIWAKRLIPHALVEIPSISEQWNIRFDNIRLESYCHPQKVDETICNIKDKICEYHTKNVNSFKKVIEAFKTCLVVKDNCIKIWDL